MRFPRSRTLPAIALLLVGCLAKPRPENERMQLGQDVLATGSAPQLYNDSIGGDAIMAGGDVNFQGSTGGDYVGAGGQQDIRGRVHGSLRAAGGNVTVRASVDRNATIGGGDIVIDSVSQIGQNAYLIGGRMRINGTVHGGLLASGGNFELNGTIGGDVEVASGNLTIGPHAQIGGNLRYHVRNKVQIDPGAKITGKVTAVPVSKRPGPFSWLWFAGMLLLWLVAVLIAPRFMTRAADAVQHRTVRAVIAGVVVGFFGLFAIGIAAFTVVGLPLALISAALYLSFFALSGVPVSLWLGERILSGRTAGGSQNILRNFYIGGLILLVVWFIPILGSLVQLVAGCIGFGALLLTAWAARETAVI